MATPDEVGRTVCREFDAFIENEPSTARWNDLRQRLAAWFATIDESSAFAGMLWVIENSERYQHQELAGELLNRRQVPLQIPLAEFIRRVVPRLNASASSLPRYVREQVGVDGGLREVKAQLSAVEDEKAKAGLRSFSYWIGAPPEE
jgi:hypothetical protein